jgi:hypothetical protein
VQFDAKTRAISSLDCSWTGFGQIWTEPCSPVMMHRATMRMTAATLPGHCGGFRRCRENCRNMVQIGHQRLGQILECAGDTAYDSRTADSTDFEDIWRIVEMWSKSVIRALAIRPILKELLATYWFTSLMMLPLLSYSR